MTSHKQLPLNVSQFGDESPGFLDIHLYDNPANSLFFSLIILCQKELKYEQLLIELAVVVGADHSLNIVIVIEKVRVDRLSEDKFCQYFDQFITSSEHRECNYLGKLDI